MHDHVAVAEIALINTGKVGFEFTALGMDPGMATKPKPGVPVMIPHAVSIICNMLWVIKKPGVRFPLLVLCRSVGKTSHSMMALPTQQCRVHSGQK